MKISVITATYNVEHHIKTACAAISAQNHPDIEWLLIDGASTDKTLSVIDGFKRKPNILLSEPDRGIYHALNKGIGLATGDVIGFLHADDFYPDDSVLARVADAFVNPDVDLVYGDLDYVYAEHPEKLLRRWVSGIYDREQFRVGWMPPHPATYMRRRHYEQYGGFDESFKISADYESMLRYLWMHCMKPAYLPSVLMRMRAGGTSNGSLRNIYRKSVEDLRAMHRYGFGIRSLICKNIKKIPQFFIAAK